MKRFFCIFRPFGRGMDMSLHEQTDIVVARDGKAAIRQFVRDTGYGEILNRSNLPSIEKEGDDWLLLYDGDSWIAHPVREV